MCACVEVWGILGGEGAKEAARKSPAGARPEGRRGGMDARSPPARRMAEVEEEVEAERSGEVLDGHAWAAPPLRGPGSWRV